MELPWLWAWADNPIHFSMGATSNHFNALELAMLESLGGDEHLVAAFTKRRKYSRAWRTLEPLSTLNPKQLWLRREAFLGNEAGCPYPQPVTAADSTPAAIAYYTLLKKKYGDDEGFKAFMARREVVSHVAERRRQGYGYEEDEET